MVQSKECHQRKKKSREQACVDYLEGHLPSVPGRSGEFDSALHVRDRLFDFGVDEFVSRSREHKVVHAILALFLRKKHAKILIEILREEGREWCHCRCKSHDDDEERVESIETLLIAVMASDALAVQPDIPVG